MADSKLILTVDDDTYIRRVIEVKLQRNGYKVVTAPNGVEGLNIIRTLKPDVVITDLNMPGMDGQALCRMTNPLKKERPFLTIVMTSRIDPEDAKWIAELQDTRFMEKPFSPAQLIASLNQYFQSTGQGHGADT